MQVIIISNNLFELIDEKLFQQNSRAQGSKGQQRIMKTRKWIGIEDLRLKWENIMISTPWFYYQFCVDSGGSTGV